MKTDRQKRPYLWRAKDCIINKMFKDSINPEHYREEYCFKNCQFKCLNGKEYKKV